MQTAAKTSAAASCALAWPFRMEPSINGIEASETNAKALKLEFGNEWRKR